MIYKQPYRISEANIKAEIYRQLVNLGYKCEVEYKTESKSIKKKYDIFDLILIIDNNIVLIIETKSKLKKQYSGLITINSETTKQLLNYSLHEIPIYLCTSIIGINRLIQFIQFHYPLTKKVS